MAIHRDLTPDFRESVARTALKALHAASAQETAGNGTVSVRNADGTTTVIGAGAGVDETGAPKGMDSFRGDTTPPGRPLGVAFSSVSCDATAYWDGRLDGGVPADFARVEFYAKKGEAKSFMGCLVEAGSLSMQFEAGDALDCWAVAFDVQGNASGESAHAALNVVDVPSQAKAAADEAKKMAEAANADIAGQAEEVRQVAAKAEAAKQAAADAQSKADATASDLDATKATVESHAGELGELSTKVSNAATKADSAITASTEAKQTATEATTKAETAYKDSQTALTASTTATQTASKAQTTAESAAETANDSLKQSSKATQAANEMSAKLATEYQTKADADKVYATQASLKATSESIASEVSKTYATKATVDALQNIADNAIESWRGSGAPTAENKPASDWTTVALKKQHNGDLYYDKATGKAYRWGSDDGVVYTWELNQDSDVTKALHDASAAQSTADSAATAASKAQSAADAAGSKADAAHSAADTAKGAADSAAGAASKAQGDVDKLKVDIPATYVTKSSFEQTAESITANVTKAQQTADSAVTASTKAQQTADGISAELSKSYQTKAQADAVYATQASLKATSESLTSSVTKAQGTADGAVTAASKAQQTADAVSLNLSKNYTSTDDADKKFATKAEVTATSESITLSVSKTYATKEALNTTDTNVAKAQSAADSASTAASSATTTANAAKSAADTASTNASSALTKANSAASDASAAKTDAATAKSTASTANKTANAAKSTADTAKSTADKASNSASSALTKASAAATDASAAKSSASTASANASNALDKSTTLETLIRQSGNGIEVAKKVNGSYTSTKTLTDETGFSVLSSTGTVLSKFSDKKIELGKNSPDAVIELCNGYGVISATNGGVKLASKSISGGYNASVRTAVSGAMISATYGDGDHYAYVNADAEPNEGAVVIGGEKLYVNAPRKSDGTDQSSGISMVGFANMVVDSGWKTIWSDTNHTVRIRRVGCCVTLFMYADAGSFGTDWKKWTKVPDEFKPSFDVYAAVAAGVNTGNNNVMLADVSSDGYVYVKTMGGTCTGVRGQVTWFLDVG